MAYIAGSLQAVDTGDTYFQAIGQLGISGSSVARTQLEARGIILNKPKHGGKPLEARAEYARWIVDCPNCNNAEFAFEDKLFFCSACHNSDIGGEVRRVKLPPERKQIEDILGKRKIINRHWFPGETVAKLESEGVV